MFDPSETAKSTDISTAISESMFNWLEDELNQILLNQPIFHVSSYKYRLKSVRIGPGDEWMLEYSDLNAPGSIAFFTSKESHIERHRMREITRRLRNYKGAQSVISKFDALGLFDIRNAFQDYLSTALGLAGARPDILINDLLVLDDQKNGHPQFRILYTQTETDGQRAHRSFDLQHLDANSRMPEYLLNRHIRLYNRLCKEIDEAGTWPIAKPPVIDAKEAIAANPNWGLF